MRIFNQEKTQEVQEYDKLLYRLEPDKLLVSHHEATPEVIKQSHYVVVAEYDNGGKDVEEVIDVPYQPAVDAYDEYEDILVLVPFTEEEKLENLRYARETECFPIINRGKLWYDNLTEQQIQDLNQWYQDWLDVTDTKVVPEKPEWLK